MKKIIFLGIFLTGTFTFSQVIVTPKGTNLNEVYKGGNTKFVQDIENNFNNFSGDFQVNGQFILTFDLNKEGEIINPKVLPEVNKEFSVALIRSFKRVKNNFNAAMPQNNLAVLMDFSTNFKNDDGRERFTTSNAIHQ